MKLMGVHCFPLKNNVYILVLGLALVVFAITILYPLYIRILWGVESTGQPMMFYGVEADCNGVERFIGEAGSGWEICFPHDFKPTKDNCKVLSWGVQNHYSFDEAMVKEGCEVHGFDPSPLGLSVKEKYDAMGGHYHLYGLGKEDDVTYAPGRVPFRWPGMGYLRKTNTYPWRLRNIPATMKDVIGTTGKLPVPLAEGGKQLTILKLDVEGAEWDIMDQLVDVEWDLLMLELHWWPKVHSVLDAGKMRGFVVTNLPNSGVKSAFSRPDIDYMQLWQKITEIGDMYHYHMNPDDKEGLCLEVFLQRKRK